MAATGAIDALHTTFSAEQIALRGTEQYTKWNSTYLAQQENDIQPACIFQPRSSQDVSQFVKLMNPFVESGNTAFAIRAGGNMPLPACANIQDGITLDLSLMNSVELEQDKAIVRIAAGARWMAVDEVVQAAGLGVTGGRSGTGGIGGLALSAGLSFFSSREGFICDNVVNFEVVLASGDVVDANADDRHDLWTALKGGSNNFGVVTRFDFRTFPQGPFWGGNVYYFPPSFPTQVDALVAELKKPLGDADPDTHIMISIGYAAQFGATVCMNTVYYTKAVRKSPPVLAPFTDIEPQIPNMNSLKPLTLTEAAAGQAAGVSNQVRCSYMNITVKADAATLRAAADLYTAGIAPLQSTVAGLVCSFTLQPYSTSLLQQSVTRGGNALGLNPEVPAVSVLLLTYWNNHSDDESVNKAMKGILEAIKATSVAKSTALDFVYLNYAAGFQDPIATYGAENNRRLREVSKKYDPNGLFQNGVPGGFKLL